MKHTLTILLLALACAVIYVATSPVSAQTSTHRAHTHVTQAQSAHSAAAQSLPDQGPGRTPDYRAIAREDARAAGISPDIFVRQINEESGFNPAAESKVGALGIAQFMPSTARGLGINPLNPLQALRAAALLMASYIRSYGAYDKALAAYNAGPGMVAYAINHGGSNWRAWLPAETQSYITIILGQ